MHVPFHCQRLAINKIKYSHFFKFVVAIFRKTFWKIRLSFNYLLLNGLLKTMALSRVSIESMSY